ncbi:serine, glycine and glutamine-rich protein-like [Saccostrea cucullata]|uniref:serine, glycine and glutamine-rich protein-like n=1 Tax=Saccostrea cuccullata TaxID=36930 RepID=UPI002ED69743
MKAVLSLLAVLGAVVCVYAGSYGGGYGGKSVYPQVQQYAYQQTYRPATTQYAQYYAKPTYAKLQYVQPSYVAVGGGPSVGFGGGSGNLLGGSGGSIIPIIIIFVLLAIFAPLLIASLTSSNEAFFDSVGS